MTVLYTLRINDFTHEINLITNIEVNSIVPAGTISVRYTILSQTITIRSPDYTLFARNLTVNPGSIYQRNKILKRLDLGPGISVVSVIKYIVSGISITALRLYTYST